MSVLRSGRALPFSHWFWFLIDGKQTGALKDGSVPLSGIHRQSQNIERVSLCFFSGNRRVGLVQQTGFCNWRESMKWTSFSVSIAPLFSRRRQGTAVSFGFSAVEGGRFPAVGG